ATRSMRKPSSTLKVLSASAGSFGGSRGSRSLSDCGGSAASRAAALITMNPAAVIVRVVMSPFIAGARGQGNPQSNPRPARLEQVANLRQQLLVFCQRRDRSDLFAPQTPQPADELHCEEV